MPYTGGDVNVYIRPESSYTKRTRTYFVFRLTFIGKTTRETIWYRLRRSRWKIINAILVDETIDIDTSANNWVRAYVSRNAVNNYLKKKPRDISTNFFQAPPPKKKKKKVFTSYWIFWVGRTFEKGQHVTYARHVIKLFFISNQFRNCYFDYY